MHEGLRTAWKSALDRVSGWRPGTDPAPVLETLSLALVLDLTGDLAAAPASELALLRERGRRALLAAGAPEGTPEADRQDAAWARALAGAGLDVIDPKPQPREPSPPADPLRPSAGRISRMLRGELDGFSAGACALALRASADGALRVLAMAEGTAEEPLAVAAQDAPPVRAPSDGTLVARLDEPEVEALLFPEPTPRRLAVYAAASDPVRLVADGVTTEEMLPGYWIGRLAEGVLRVEAELHVGDGAVPWSFDLPE